MAAGFLYGFRILTPADKACFTLIRCPSCLVVRLAVSTADVETSSVAVAELVAFDSVYYYSYFDSIHIP